MVGSIQTVVDDGRLVLLSRLSQKRGLCVANGIPTQPALAVADATGMTAVMLTNARPPPWQMKNELMWTDNGRTGCVLIRAKELLLGVNVLV